MRKLGLVLDDLDGREVLLLPDCVQAANVMTAMYTQWRVGMSGPIGLDYSALPAVLRLCEIPAKDRGAVFDDIRVMEAEALNTMHEARDRG